MKLLWIISVDLDATDQLLIYILKKAATKSDQNGIMHQSFEDIPPGRSKKTRRDRK
jgi:hypothetical protein